MQLDSRGMKTRIDISTRADGVDAMIVGSLRVSIGKRHRTMINCGGDAFPEDEPCMRKKMEVWFTGPGIRNRLC